jgi:hypothetical protein
MRICPVATLCVTLLAAACTDAAADVRTAADARPEGSADAATDPSSPRALPDPVCQPSSAWTPGTPLLARVDGAMGLDAIGVLGNRMSAVDLDGDHRVDLAIRRAGVRWSDFADPEAARHHWQLMNRDAGFVDETEALGLWTPRSGQTSAARPGDVVVFGDVDNDGDPDAYVGFDTTDTALARGETAELMRNAGDGAFGFASRTLVLRQEGALDAAAGASFVDVDRDGHLDLWVGRHNVSTPGGVTFLGDKLYRNDGALGMEDATAAFGLTTVDWLALDAISRAEAHSRSWSTVACDLNNDGWPELLSASYGRAPNHLWQAVPSATGVRFENRSVESGYAFDGNQTWTDNQFAACFCQRNPDEPGCADAIAPSISCDQQNWNHTQDREPFRLGGNSGTTVCADLNNDGYLDLLTTEIRHWWAGAGADGSDVLLNRGTEDVTFDRVPREAIGLVVPHVTDGGWDEGHITAAVMDLDNDGRNDVFIGGSEYAGNQGLLYMQGTPQGGLPQFTRVTPPDAPEHNRAQGIVAADFDNDGDLDLLVGHSRSRCDASAPNDCYPTAQPRLYENVLGQSGNWAQFTLTGGEGSNRSAIGARVTVTTSEGVQVHEVGGGFGHYGNQNPLRVHAGLGGACEASVEVRWPDAAGTTETFEVVSGYHYLVTQGAPLDWVGR